MALFMGWYTVYCVHCTTCKKTEQKRGFAHVEFNEFVSSDLKVYTPYLFGLYIRLDADRPADITV